MWCQIPKHISPRVLFWLWYDRLTLAQKEMAHCDFQRFVVQSEQVIEACQSAPQRSAKLQADPRDLQGINHILREHAEILRNHSQALRNLGQLQVAKSQNLRSKSQLLLQKSQIQIKYRSNLEI